MSNPEQRPPPMLIVSVAMTADGLPGPAVSAKFDGLTAMQMGIVCGLARNALQKLVDEIFQDMAHGPDTVRQRKLLNEGLQAALKLDLQAGHGASAMTVDTPLPPSAVASVEASRRAHGFRHEAPGDMGRAS